jgi:hypothetical protein
VSRPDAQQHVVMEVLLLPAYPVSAPPLVELHARHLPEDVLGWATRELEASFVPGKCACGGGRGAWRACAHECSARACARVSAQGGHLAWWYGLYADCSQRVAGGSMIWAHTAHARF